MRSGLVSDVFAQTALMNFYAKSGDLGAAKLVFDGISAKDPISCNCLISAYTKSGDVLAARKVFDEMTDRTIASWNSVISCYANNGDCLEGLRMFEKMRDDKFRPNEITVVTVLSMCAKLQDLEMGLRIKKLIDDNNLCVNMMVSTAILQMFVKCGNVDEARQEFERMNERDIVAWSSMIAGYAQNGRSLDALDLFGRMKNEHIKPNDVAILSVLSACGHLGSSEIGEQIENYVECHNLEENIQVASALLDMYSKCGNIEKARQVFDRMPHPDIVALNSMINGLSYNGFSRDAIALYGKLVDYKLHPDEITFLGLLNTCTHAGFVEQGVDFFRSMREDHGITPQIEHYACMVDLFCRSGRLKDAYEFICGMEIEPNAVIWGALLSACRVHHNAELAELSIQKLLQLEPENSGNYVLVSNLHVTAGRWEEALKLRDLMKDKNVQKNAACSWLEVGNRVHKFLVGDTMHPKSSEISGIVDSLAVQLAWACHALKPELEF